MSVYEYLPPLNAVLNASAGITVWTAHRALVKHGNVQRHKRLMIAGVVISALFLVSYLTYHIALPPYAFPGQGLIRPIYFTMLTSHIILAIAIVPLILFALATGLRSQFPRHKKITKWAYPLWMYVSVTGVLIYLARFVPQDL